MSKEEIFRKYRYSPIRCLTSDEFDEILDLFDSENDNISWNKYKEYTWYFVDLDKIEKCFKSNEEILANDIIKEFKH